MCLCDRKTKAATAGIVADAAGFENGRVVSGHDADESLARCHDAGRIGTDDPTFRNALARENLQHIVRRNVFGERDDSPDASIDRINDGSLCHRWRDEDDGNIAWRMLGCLDRRSVDRCIKEGLTCTLGIDAGGDVSYHFTHPLRPESTLLAGHALNQNFLSATINHCAASTAAFTASSIKS